MSALDTISIWRLAAVVNPDGQLRRLTSVCATAFILAALAMLPNLLGCSAFDGNVAQSALQHVEDISETIEELAPRAPPRYSVLAIDPERPWTGLSVIEDEVPALPDELVAGNAVSLSLAGITEDDTLAATIEAATGVPVRFSGSRPVEAPDDPFQTTPTALPEGGIWTGPLDVLLDAWTATRGYRWHYDLDEAEIRVVRSEAIVFRLNALAGVQTASGSTAASDAAGESEAGNTASQAITTEATYDPWTEITEQLAAILDPSAVIAAAPATASMTVAGLSRDIDRARRYMDWLNRTALRPITLTVAVYTVRFTDQSSFDIGIAGTLERIFGTSAGLSVISNEISVIRPGPAADTLTAAVGALQEAGSASRELTATLPSLNAQPAQFTELFSRAYLKEIRTTLQDGLLQTNLIPGTIASGFSLTYTAQIVSPGEVLVRLFASIVDRPAFEVFAAGGAGAALRLQLPSFGNRAVTITQRVGRGETLVITGFRDRATTGDRSGTFDADVPLPLGGVAAEDILTEQVLLIRAEAGAPMGILERPGEVL